MPSPSRIRRGCPEGDKTPLADCEPRPIAFFDRDGVLNVDRGYVHSRQEFVWIEGALEALNRFKEEGWWVVVVTNQSGIERGFYTEADMLDLSEWLMDQAPIDLLLYCPHLTNCPARKPGSAMIESAFSILPGIREKSFLVGDKETDLQAAEAADVRGLPFDVTMGDLNKFLQKELQ